MGSESCISAPPEWREAALSEPLSIPGKALSVRDHDRAAGFHGDVMGLKILYPDAAGMRACGVGDRSIVLLIVRGRTTEPVQTGGGPRAPHSV